MTAFPTGIPGLQTDRTATPIELLLSTTGKKLFPTGGRLVDGTKGGDPGNTPDVDTLRAGKVMGLITTGSKWRPSIIGNTNGAVANGDTTVTVVAAVATEIARLITAAGGNVNLKLTGPPTAAGVVRTLQVTCSAAAGTTLTLTGAPNVNEVQTITPTGDASAGSWSFTIVRPTGVPWSTGPLAFSASIATIQTALDIASGVANGIVASGTGAPVDIPNAMVLTYSGTGYAGLPQTLATIDEGTSLTGNTGFSIVRTTAGVDGRFVTASHIQPADGAEVPRGLLYEEWGQKLSDVDGARNDVPLAKLLVGGMIRTGKIADYPADASLKTWLKQQLKVYCPDLTFDDDF